MKRFLKIEQRAFFGLLLLAFIGWLVAGCASPKQYAYSPLPGDTSETAGINQTEERFAVGDLVIVKFLGLSVAIPEHEERIKENGTITLPLIGVVKASGKNVHELEQEIRDRYVPDYYKHLSVAVVDERRSYFVGGQVQRPGRQVYLGLTTVTKAVESAGGFTEFAARRRVELTRDNGQMFRVDCRKAAHDASLDLPVYPGDRIYVLQGPAARDFFQ